MKKRAHLFYAQLGLTLLTCLFLVVPVVQSILAGVTKNYFRGVKSGLTLKWIFKVWELYRDTIFTSIFIGVACLAITLIIGVPAAYFMVKKKSRFTRLMEEFLVIPLAIPGLAIALAILISYGQFTSFRKSWIIILIGHVVFTLPFMIRSVIAIMSAINLKDLEEGAASLGGEFWNRFFHIIIPNSMPGILAGSLMVFTLSIGEFNLTWMLHTPFTKTLPVGLADSYASMRLEIGSAYTIVFFFMIIPLLLAMQWIAKPKKSTAINADELKDMPMKPQQTKPAANPSVNAPKANRKKDSTSIHLRNCGKTFPDGSRALEPIDLDIDPGQTVVILGPSGCGKTTTLRIIAGLENPDEGGKVLFGDDDVTDIPIEKRNVGMVFQSYALFPNMNVAENIAYGLKIRGDSKEKREGRVNEMLSMMQLEEFKNRKIDQLSGGQRQRVALARAIAVRPRVLLLDEPLTALDAKLRDSLRIEIDMLLKSVGITAVYVTHDQGEAMALGDKIVVMDHGRIAMSGSPRDVYFNPENHFVADFIGTLNTIESEVKDRMLTLPSGKIPLNGIKHLESKTEGPVKLFFRPEHTKIVDPGLGHLKGNVVSSFFMGDKTSLVVDVQSAELIKIEAQGIQKFTNGDRIELKLDLNHLFTF